ncbi:MAG: DNA-3-methyladenine glycosylase family protein [Candidatus Saccharimonadaceae bacterium]
MTSWSEELEKGVQHLSNVDPVLKSVISIAPNPTFSPHKNYYESLVGSIISQQLSVKAAATILNRFKELFVSDFPLPEDILEKDIETYRAVGLSRQKASYIRDLAERVIDGTIKFDHLDSLTNQEVIDELIQVKGVGVWTVHMFLIFCMGRFDVLPTGDLGIRNGIEKLYKLQQRPNDLEIEAIARSNHWKPYESIASWYVWHSLDNKPAL